MIADLQRIRDEYRWLNEIGHGHRSDRDPDRDPPIGRSSTAHSDPTGKIAGDLEGVRDSLRWFARNFRSAVVKWNRILARPLADLAQGYERADATYAPTDKRIRRDAVIDPKDVTKAREAKMRRQERGEDYGVA